MGDGVVQLPRQHVALVEPASLKLLPANDAPVADRNAQCGGKQQHHQAANRVGGAGEVGGDADAPPREHDHRSDRCLSAGPPPEQRVQEHHHGCAGVQGEAHVFGEHGSQVHRHEGSETKCHHSERLRPSPQGRERQDKTDHRGDGPPRHVVAEESLGNRGSEHERSERPIAPDTGRRALDVGLGLEPIMCPLHHPKRRDGGTGGGSTESVVPVPEQRPGH